MAEFTDNDAVFDGESPAAPPALPVDTKAIVAEIQDDYTQWRSQKRSFEGNWYVNGAMLRGQQRVHYDDALAKLVSPIVASHRIQLTINRIRPKILARLSKFFKNRPKADVIPASTERKDVLNARATQKVLDYQWQRLKLEQKHKDARLWATIGGKGFWWFSWETQSPGRVLLTDDVTGATHEETAPLGDVAVEVGSVFELFVADPTQMRIGSQPRILRAKLRSLKDVSAKYPEVAERLRSASASGGDDTSRYAERLATLNVRENLTYSPNAPRVDQSNKVLVLEHFVAPCADYPKGRYAVVIGDELARLDEELPYELYTHPENPYPVVEFFDQVTPGQFWTTTLIEQLLDIQREYNFVRSLISENIRMMARPKIIVYKQHNLPDGAWTTAAGEIVELSWVPGLPPPTIMQPANIVGDCWNLLGLIQREFDDVTQVYPASEGKTSGATSGFQTNLLQEATNSVHAPDIREDELAIEEAAWKIRRLCKLGYDTPRLISITGPKGLPEVMEFSAKQIDEYAEVRVQVGSMLPELKSARIQSALELYSAGIFGPPADPAVRKRMLSLIDMGGFEVMHEDSRVNEDDAQLVIQKLERGEAVRPAQFYEDHPTHIEALQNNLKSPETQAQAPEILYAKLARLLTHYDFINPQLAMGLRVQYGLTDLPVATPPILPLGAPIGAPQGGASAPPPAPTGHGAPTSAIPPTGAPPAPSA